MPSLKRLLHCLFYLSHGLYKDLTLWDQPCWKTANNSPVAFAAVAWARCQGGGPHMWTLELELLSDQGRAWKWVRVIEWNWTVLPLIRCIKKGGLFLSREPVFGPLFHSSRPLPTSAFHQRPERSKISARLEAFLWGLGAAAAARTKPDQKKDKEDQKAECLYGNLTFSSPFLHCERLKKKNLLLKSHRVEIHAWGERRLCRPPPLAFLPSVALAGGRGMGGRGCYGPKMWPHTLRQSTWTLVSDSWNGRSGFC